MPIASKYFSSMKPSRVLISSACAACLSLFPIYLALSAQPPNSQPPPTTTTQPKSEDSSSHDLLRLTDRVLKLELDVAKVPQASQGSNLATAVIAGSASLIAVLIAGLLTLLGQRFMAKREEERVLLTSQRAVELARQEAVFQHTEKIIEFRLKQLELFYAPMRALLEQSNALYIKMELQLENDEPARYKRLEVADSEGDRFYVCHNGKWKGFRLLDQLPAVKANSKALALVEGILKIGEQTTQIISKHAGLASQYLANLLGEYLAHYAILSTIHKSGETKPYEPGWHKIGYYPRELNEKVKAGYDELSMFLDNYAEISKQMLETLPEVKTGKKG